MPVQVIISTCTLPEMGKSLMCCGIQGWYEWNMGKWPHLRLARAKGEVTQGPVVNCKELDVFIHVIRSH